MRIALHCAGLLTARQAFQSVVLTVRTRLQGQTEKAQISLSIPSRTLSPICVSRADRRRRRSCVRKRWLRQDVGKQAFKIFSCPGIRGG